MSLVLTCHVVFLGSDLHLGFVDILDYSCAVDRITDWSYRRSRTKQHQITSHHITWFLSGSHLKSPAANLASAKEKAASLITSPILVLVYERETKEQSRPLDKHSVEILQQYMHWSEWSNPFFLTDFDDFAEDLAEAHGESVGFLLQQVAAGLSSFQPSLHDGLSPASPNRTHSLWMLQYTEFHYLQRSRSLCWDVVGT